MKRIYFTILTVLVAAISASAQVKTLPESVTWDRICSHPASLPVAGQLTVAESDLNRPSYWSVGSETLDRDYANFDNYIDYMKATGVGYARLQSGWAKCEPKIGKYKFEWLDHHVDGLIEQGIHPWMCLCYGNPAYTSLGYDLNAGIFGDGKVMDGWIKYVKQIAARYKGKVTMYEVWNEPDGAKPANGVKGESWREYANLFVHTAKAIKEVDPDAKVAAFGAYSINNDYFRNGLAEIQTLGGIDLIDYVTYHAYWPLPERIVPHVERLKATCKEFSPRIQVLQGECGCPAQLEYGHAMCKIEWTEVSQAKWDLRHMLLNFSMGVPSSVFTMVDLNYGWMIQSYGLIRMNLKSQPQYLRPKYHAVQNVTSLITTDIKPVGGIKNVNSSIDLPIRITGLEKAGQTIGCLIWLSGERPSDSLERKLVNISLKGLQLKDPVYVDMMSGTVYEISQICTTTENGIDFKNLPLWDCPVAIIERNDVNFK